VPAEPLPSLQISDEVAIQMHVRGKCYACGEAVDILLPSAVPSFCDRRRCRLIKNRERLIVTQLLERDGWSHTSGIVQSADLSPAAVHDVLARLYRRGWLEVRVISTHPSQAGPCREYRLTDAGASAAPEALGISSEPHRS
jgi:DNA-binding HxlR family transcriptional regulator